MVLVILTSIVAVAGASLWLLFRRPSPSTLRLPANLPNNMELVSQLSEEDSDALKTAFLRGSDFRWLVAGTRYKTELDDKQHWLATSYMVGCMMAFSQRYGYIFVCRDGKDGSFLGCVTMIPPYKSSTLYLLHFIRSAISLGKPPTYGMGKEVGARFDAFRKCMDVHKNSMKGIDHYYIPIVGVVDKAQGKGVGRQLMQTAKTIAGDLPFYLDCHNGNVAFYEKTGMTVYRKYQLTPKGIDDTETFCYNSMVYGLKN